MSVWTEHSVADVAAKVRYALATGPFGSAISSRFFQADGIPVIRGGNLSQDVGTRLIDDDWVFISEAKAAEFSRSVVRRDDLVFTCWGTIDQVGLIDDSAKYLQYVISNKQMKLTPDPARFDSHFLYYLFKSPDVRDRIRSIAIGSSVPGFNLGQLRSMRIRTPEIAEQRAIAHVLCVLDGKIQLNRRVNHKLEELARILFTSWFVDFEPVMAKRDGRQPIGVPADAVDLFPSHFADSELGPIPQGWRTSTIGAEVTVVGGSTPSTQDARFWNGNVCWVTPRDLSRLADPVVLDSERRITEEGLAQISSGLLPAGAVLLSSRAPIGYIAVAEVPVAINQGFIAMKCDRQLSPYYVLNWTRVNLDEVLSRAGGTTFAEISKAAFRPIQLVVPPEAVLAAFDAIAAPLRAMLVANVRESRTLAELRDTLLAPLLSGELTIRAAEKAVEEAV